MFLKLLLVIFTFVELNCENFFDTENNPLKNDDEYTETSLLHWNKRRYYEKLHNISREILSCAEHPNEEGEGHAPDMVALCEVENDSVMVGLTKRSMLWSYHYDYLITHSPDERGINTALMYNPDAFKLLESNNIRVELPDKKPTRDILYAKGLIINFDTLHVFVVHSPSRRGGEKATRHNRMEVAKRLSASIDSINNALNRYKFQPHQNHIIIAGDFNDYSGDQALRLIEQSGLTEISKNAIGIYPENECKGTYYFNEKWNSLDHIFTANTMLPMLIDCGINNHPKLLEPNKDGILIPKRNYRGPKYNHGFSDHLPLVARFNININTAYLDDKYQ